MKLTNIKGLPLALMSAVLLVMSGCDKPSTSSDSALVRVAPVAVNDSALGVSGQPVTILVVQNDTDIENNLDVASVQIIGTANPGDSLVVTGEGTWSVSITGSVTFTPEPGFTNDPSVINYIVFDTEGFASNSATVTIDYPQTAPVAVDDDANGTSGFAATINVLANDTDAENDINTSSIHITGTTNPGDTLVVAGEGNWSVSPVHTVIFTPQAGFTGDPESITYTITDNTGLTSNYANVSIDYPQTAPVAVDDNETNSTLGTATTLNVVENDTDAENDINASTVHFVDGNAEDTNGDDYADSLVVGGEGNWTVDAEGNVTFTPEANFTGDPTLVFYTVTDNTGLESNEANITIDYFQPIVPILPTGSALTFENNTPVLLVELITGLLPDLITTTSTINVTGATSSISKVTVSINLLDASIIDCDMILVSPSGTTVRLSSGNLIDINGYLNTTFDDSASTPVPVGILLSGSYIPEEPLSTLNGEDANGG